MSCKATYSTFGTGHIYEKKTAHRRHFWLVCFQDHLLLFVKRSIFVYLFISSFIYLFICIFIN